MKKITLAIILTFSFFTFFSVDAQARTWVLNKKDVAAIKKGTFVHAKGKVGDVQRTLAKKNLKKKKDGQVLSYYQHYDAEFSFLYDFTLLNYKTKGRTSFTYDTVQYVNASFDGPMNTAILNKHFKRVKKYDYYSTVNIKGYKDRGRYILTQSSKYGSNIWIFKNESALKYYWNNAG